MSAAAIKELIAQRIADAFETYDANRNSGNGNGNGDGSHDSGSGGRRTSHTTRGCTYKEFLNCQPLNFKGTEGAVGLAYWFEKMELVFHISNCTVECQVKYSNFTLLGSVLTWWNSHVRTVGHDAAYEMPWKTFMKMMTETYCPRNEIKKLEIEMLPEESDKVEKYTGGLPDSIQGNVMSARPKTLQEAIELAKDLMDQKCMLELYHCATSAIFITIGHALQSARTTKELVMWHETVGVQLLLTIKKTLTCFKCGNQGHYNSDCRKLKNQGRGNQSKNGEARGRVYALGGGEADQDLNDDLNYIDA
ncbi:reverse transcriptase domain-containing protein [Tanacetum coccineum]